MMICTPPLQLGQSPFLAACEQGHITIVQLLIDKGAKEIKFDKVTTYYLVACNEMVSWIVL